MLWVSIACFAVAALGGAFLGTTRVRSEANPPMPIALVHGALAAAGLVLLLVHVVSSGYPTLASISAGLFGVAALGGFVLFATHLKGKLISAGLVGVHAVAAVAGFVLLLAGVWA